MVKVAGYPDDLRRLWARMNQGALHCYCHFNVHSRQSSAWWTGSGLMHQHQVSCCTVTPAYSVCCTSVIVIVDTCRCCSACERSTEILAQSLAAKQAVSFATSLWSVAESVANAMATADHNASGSSVSLLLQTLWLSALHYFAGTLASDLVNHSQT